jgi:hypothetical protein
MGIAEAVLPTTSIPLAPCVLEACLSLSPETPALVVTGGGTRTLCPRSGSWHRPATRVAPVALRQVVSFPRQHPCRHPRQYLLASWCLPHPGRMLGRLPPLLQRRQLPSDKIRLKPVPAQALAIRTRGATIWSSHQLQIIRLLTSRVCATPRHPRYPSRKPLAVPVSWPPWRAPFRLPQSTRRSAISGTRPGRRSAAHGSRPHTCHNNEWRLGAGRVAKATSQAVHPTIRT